MAVSKPRIAPKVLASTPSRLSLAHSEEKYQLLWLDGSVNETEDNLATQKKLRQTINQLKTFDNVKECTKHVHSIEGTKQKIILIVSGKFGRELIPRIHDVQELSAFYVYCMAKDSNKQWADNYQKSKGVFTKPEQLISQVKEDQRLLERTDTTSIGISIYSRNSDAKLEHRNAMFMYLQIFIEIILKMQEPEAKSQKDLLGLLRSTYEDNDEQLRLICEFEREYAAHKALWWYTRETCFYRILNKALREHDFGLLLHFRFFITDLYKQLITEHQNYLHRLSSTSDPVLRVYRGQAIKIDELNVIRENVGEFISMDSFLSTAIDETTPLGFAKQVTVTDDTQRIIFVIDINTRLNSSKPFANIRHLSYFADTEDEVLIMMGSIFQIKDIKFSQKQNMWIAKLVMCSDDDYALKDIFAYEKKLLGADPGLVGLGRMLGDMGNYEQATSILTQALMKSQSDFETQNCYLMLGAVARLQDDYDTSLRNYMNCLDIQLDIYSSDEPHIAQTYSEIADLYCRKKEYDLSLEYSQKAFEILPLHHNHRANVYRTMGNVYRDRAAFKLALEHYKKALEIQKRTLPKDHNHIGRTYNQIGVVYELQDDYSSALQCYIDALRILRKTLPPAHEEVERAEKHVRDVKGKINGDKCVFERAN